MGRVVTREDWPLLLRAIPAAIVLVVLLWAFPVLLYVLFGGME